MKAFEYDIYISYAPSDNIELKENQRGWVDNFKYFLDKVFRQVVGEMPRFLEYANKEKPAATELAKVAVMVCVVSPDYVKKASCIDDILYFYEELQKEGVPEREIQKRIFKVVKYPVPAEELPGGIKNVLSYDLFNLNTTSGQVDEFRDFFSTEAEGSYWLKMVDLAYDMQEALHLSKENPDWKNQLQVGNGNAIYLAETSPDLTLQRNIIKRELQKFGYKVLPDRSLPGNIREMEATIKKDLQHCKMSIHLIGSMYGEVPKGSTSSVVEIQNKIAAERSNLALILQKKDDDPAFSRLIWLSPELKFLQDKQYQFIETLKKEVEDEESTEMVQTPLEDFKNILRRELNPEERFNTGNNNGFVPDLSRRQATAQIYLIYDKIDRQAVEPIIEYIKNRELHVITPAFEGNLIDIQKQHVENLKNFDAAIIYQGVVSEQWVRMKVLDILKAPGYGRKKPILAKALLAGKGARNFAFAQSFDLELIDNTTAFSADDLDQVLSQITQ